MTQVKALVDAYDAFIRGCKTDGTWNAIKASCIMAGWDGLNGALAPLVGTAPTNNNFVSGDYNRKTGLAGDGSTKYLDSNYALTSTLRNNRHSSVWASTVHQSGTGAYLGSSNTTSLLARTQILVVSGSEDKVSSRVADETTTTSAESDNVAGFIGVSRSTSVSYARRAASADQTISVSSLSGEENSMFVFRRNNTSSSVYSNARIAFYSIGESLDLALLDARVTTLVNAIAAAIP